MYVKFLTSRDKAIYEKLLIELFDEEIEEEGLVSSEIINPIPPKKEFLTRVSDASIISEEDGLSSSSSSSDSIIFTLNEDVELTSSSSEEETKISDTNYLFVVGKITNDNYKEILNLSKGNRLIGLYIEFDNYYLLRDEILESFTRIYFKQLSDFNIIKYKINSCYYNYLPDALCLLSENTNPRTEVGFQDRNIIFILSSENIILADSIFDLLRGKDINLKIVDSSVIYSKLTYHINLILNNNILVTDDYVAIWLAIITSTPVFIINSSREIALLSSEIGINKFNFDSISEFSLKYMGKLEVIREKMTNYLSQSINLVNNIKFCDYFQDKDYQLSNTNRTNNKFYIPHRNIKSLTSNSKHIYKSLYKQSSISGIYLDFLLDFEYPILHPWAGFIHSDEEFQSLILDMNFRSSLNMCRGLFTFNIKVKSLVDIRLEDVNCHLLAQPIFEAENLTRYHLKGRQVRILAPLIGDLERLHSLKNIKFFKLKDEDEDADFMISRSEVFARSSSYNNVILLNDHNPEILNEAVIRNIPILVERIDHNVQLLGVDYPLFFDNIGELPELNLYNLKLAVDKIKLVDMTKFTLDNLVKSLNILLQSE